jgi:hypothetical protein
MTDDIKQSINEMLADIKELVENGFTSKEEVDDMIEEILG